MQPPFLSLLDLDFDDLVSLFVDNSVYKTYCCSSRVASVSVYVLLMISTSDILVKVLLSMVSSVVLIFEVVIGF